MSHKFISQPGIEISFLIIYGNSVATVIVEVVQKKRSEKSTVSLWYRLSLGIVTLRYRNAIVTENPSD